VSTYIWPPPSDVHPRTSKMSGVIYSASRGEVVGGERPEDDGYWGRVGEIGTVALIYLAMEEKEGGQGCPEAC
jgi:hypothetical protein